MKITNAMIMEKLNAIEARQDGFEKELKALKESKESKTSSTKKSTASTTASTTRKSKSTKKSKSTWDKAKYIEVAEELGVRGKTVDCYEFARGIANSYARGEITMEEAKKQYKALPKPEWF